MLQLGGTAIMKKKTVLFALCFMCVGLCACGTKTDNTVLQQAQSSSVTETEQINNTTEPTQSTQTEDTLHNQTEDVQSDKNKETSSEPSEAEAITEDQALNAIKNYCFTKNPDLKNMADSDEYTVYWEVTTNDVNEIVVLYRSYTGAQNRYYIEPVSGETYVTELVPGIIDEEQRTEESLNIRDYLA